MSWPMGPLRDALFAPGGRVWCEVYVGNSPASYAGARTFTLDLGGWTPPPPNSQLVAQLIWIGIYIVIAVVVVGGSIGCYLANRRSNIENVVADALASKYARESRNAIKIKAD